MFCYFLTEPLDGRGPTKPKETKFRCLSTTAFLCFKEKTRLTCCTTQDVCSSSFCTTQDDVSERKRPFRVCHFPPFQQLFVRGIGTAIKINVSGFRFPQRHVSSRRDREWKTNDIRNTKNVCPVIHSFSSKCLA